MQKIKKSTKSQLKEGKMRVSRIVTTAILVLMLTAVMGLRDVEAQTPLACTDTPFTTGWLSMPVTADAGYMQSNFVYNAGLLGTVENFNGNVVAGLDWLYDDRQPNLETNMVGTQLVSWWTRKDDRNTILQATNTNPDTNLIGVDTGIPGFAEGMVTVHVQILGENCVEIINFCDVYTPLDTVVYDFSNIVSNVGQVVSSGGLAGREGIVTITPVETCDPGGPQFDAVSWNFMQGNARIINETQDWEYGTNVRARTAAPAEPYSAAGSPIVTRNFVWDFYSAVSPSTCDTGIVNDINCPAGKLFKDFDQVGTNTGSDLVLISFVDHGLCGSNPDGPSHCDIADVTPARVIGSPGVYKPVPIVPATAFGDFAIYDANEVVESCPPVVGCFLRIGIDAGIPSTDDVEPTPPVPTCEFIDGEPVCADPLCKQETGCENFTDPEAGLCSDGIDNDEVDGTDCADFGCDGFVIDEETGAVCEAGGETSCADGEDNDNNGLIDCGEGDILPADPNCVLIGACDAPDDGGSGGSSGCTVAAGPVTSGSSAANFLLPLLPLAGVFAVRRIIRRRRK
jgi:hypothetical protein